MKLPVMLRSTYEKEVNELKKDIKKLEFRKSELELELKQEKADKKSSIGLLNGSLKMSNARNAELEEEVVEKNRQLTIANSKIKELEAKVAGMEWCIKERDKELEETRKVNRKLLDKVTFSNEMYRQFKEKCDKAMEIQFVTRTITASEVKKFLKVEDVLDLYTLIGMAGK